MRSNKSHGLSSVAVTQSLFGTQKSYAGIRSCTLLSSLMIENTPIVTNTRLSSLLLTKFSSNTPQMSAGTELKSVSSQQQQQLSFGSTTLHDSAIGSTNLDDCLRHICLLPILRVDAAAAVARREYLCVALRTEQDNLLVKGCKPLGLYTVCQRL